MKYNGRDVMLQRCTMRRKSGWCVAGLRFNNCWVAISERKAKEEDSVRKLLLLIIPLMLAACTPTGPTAPTAALTTAAVAGPSATLTAAPTTPMVARPSATPTITSTETPLPHTTVDASTMEKKMLMGYQGWFSCPNDTSNRGWFHWFKTNAPDAANFRVDMWPDPSELTPDERCPTQMKYPNGQPAYLYSSYNPKTVMRHFQWMSQYGVDGVFLQRFVTEIIDPKLAQARNFSVDYVRAGAEAYGRVFAMEYAIANTDADPNLVSEIEEDWKYLVDVKKVTESPSYLHQKGKPVLGIYGLGFKEYQVTPQQAMELVNFFEKNPDPKYQVTLMGGVPTWWRILQNDSLTDPGWMNYYCALNVISPWTVGRYNSDLEVDLYKLTMQQDMVKAKECGAEYMPVVYPGTSLHNAGGVPFNLIPRRGGELYWRQVYDAVSIGVPMIFNAMFDEVDEDTAMYKIAATKADEPVGVDLVSMDTDGYKLPSDWYLRLAGAATQMLRGEIPLSAKIPIESGAAPPPTPTGTSRIRIQIVTTSDWTTLNLKSGGTLINARLVSVSPEAVNLGANGNRFTIGQFALRVTSGASVELVVDADLANVHAGTPLEFVLEKGANGDTTIKLLDIVHDPPIDINTMVVHETTRTFVIPVDKFIPSGAVALPTPTFALMTLGTPFTGTWQGIDRDDGSTTVLSLVQTGNELTGTFNDSYSAGIKPPGLQGNGSGTVLSASTSQMTFNLARWDGKTTQTAFHLTLSNQNNTLTLDGCGAGCLIVLQRQ